MRYAEEQRRSQESLKSIREAQARRSVESKIPSEKISSAKSPPKITESRRSGKSGGSKSRVQGAVDD